MEQRIGREGAKLPQGNSSGFSVSACAVRRWRRETLRVWAYPDDLLDAGRESEENLGVGKDSVASRWHCEAERGVSGRGKRDFSGDGWDEACWWGISKVISVLQLSLTPSHEVWLGYYDCATDQPIYHSIADPCRCG